MTSNDVKWYHGMKSPERLITESETERDGSRMEGLAASCVRTVIDGGTVVVVSEEIGGSKHVRCTRNVTRAELQILKRRQYSRTAAMLSGEGIFRRTLT